MCRNCAFAIGDSPSNSEECSICLRNPKIISQKFEPKIYNEEQIDRPIDMYVSKEFWRILQSVILKRITKALSQRDKEVIPWFPWYPTTWNDNTWSFHLVEEDPVNYEVKISTPIPIEKKNRRRKGRKNETKQVPIHS